MKNQIELRFKSASVSSTEDGSLRVSGYVNKTDQQSEILGGKRKFVEKISKGVFKRALSNGRPVDFLAEHDNEKILASTRNESLVLKEDEEGLYMEANIAPTTWGKDTYTLIKHGLYQNMSFGFKVVKDEWRKLERDLYERTIKELELLEVSVVKSPAYSQSTIAARGLNVLEDVEIPNELKMEEQSLENEQNLSELLKVIAEAQEVILDFINENREQEDDKKDKEKEEQTEKPEEVDKLKEKEVKDEAPEGEEGKSSEDEEKKKKDEEEKRSLELSAQSLREKLNKLKEGA